MSCHVMSADLKLVLEPVLERDERECIDVGVKAVVRNAAIPR